MFFNDFLILFWYTINVVRDMTYIPLQKKLFKKVKKILAKKQKAWYNKYVRLREIKKLPFLLFENNTKNF